MQSRLEQTQQPVRPLLPLVGRFTHVCTWEVSQVTENNCCVEGIFRLFCPSKTLSKRQLLVFCSNLQLEAEWEVVTPNSR
jgi:hypothetical protein